MIKIKVFVDDANSYGNTVGIMLDENNELNLFARQKIAKQSGFSEVVFINNINLKSVSIFTPIREIPFAGHALVGAAYFLSELLNTNIETIECLGNLIRVRKFNNQYFVKSNIKVLPDWNFEELNSPENVESITQISTLLKQHCFVWAWVDKDKGIIRARTFANDWGIPEDEANGSGAMRLAYKLKRDIKVMHGQGSIVYAKYISENICEVGGNVIPYDC